MNFDKVINNMQELQSKIEIYERNNKSIEDTIASINKDILKLEKKRENSKDEIDKHILSIKILLMKDIVDKFNIENNQSKK
ncbi:MAG: hypothetical protein ACI4OT_04230 [Bacilli bacterium]